MKKLFSWLTSIWWNCFLNMPYKVNGLNPTFKMETAIRGD